ncbi:hypothetical protein B0H67DRAFT_579571 [Lasiosphaeris hirsuta]|uniref:Uncharacterized protein n=1 Tax=Lasiosphaeris hirsuta TaxID=260670 RepID=A0AA40DSW2_9PEZI|nr:hypothetical protein B0H67DRAFT_579571 [Lasiosphaeris hirsuta]
MMMAVVGRKRRGGRREYRHSRLRDPRTPINMADTQSTAASAPALGDSSSPVISSSPTDRRNSAEWDASKVPPSRFQKRKGSIYAVPGSRDGHVDNNYASKFHAKHAEMWKDGVPGSNGDAGSTNNHAGNNDNATTPNSDP